MQTKVRDSCLLISKMFLKTSISREEYMHIPVRFFLKEIIEVYSLVEKTNAEGNIYIQIKKLCMLSSQQRK